jgi:hypothetical protein
MTAEAEMIIGEAETIEITPTTEAATETEITDLRATASKVIEANEAPRHRNAVRTPETGGTREMTEHREAKVTEPREHSHQTIIEIRGHHRARRHPQERVTDAERWAT